ncbi:MULTISPECIES: hypothetical protein [unclassified Beijerinckia]|uniref:protein-L-isoaspartate O-methyltransferase family protein n=1 Tax=unclassified Beijerinckia TaxID=2638183 RepID=UPI00089A5833|nr:MULTISPECIES: hypothetical protein [unclassified Beijerinckia]MDH7795905.1 protein-L-isoaspartate(D-aspartate) O-methyltransferase [Beijerinckia sp. GAS462]SEC21536.1 protein-L-isoaspartate(D-aspartate) O-methyltransferase [Beijerinckia sp. 28-YEA-48]
MVSTVALRRYYASLVTAGLDGRLTEAFAKVPRERFVGPGPWYVSTGTGYVKTPSDDLCFLYTNAVLALRADRTINNGEPRLHGRCLAALEVVAGERIAHIGAGTGYYTAILAELTGPTGSVAAFEIDPELANRAAINLAGFPHVTIYAQSGTEPLSAKFDVIYVNAGATRPLDAWLDALDVGGRLLFPLTPDRPINGMMLLVTRRADNTFDARFAVGPVVFIDCEGARTDWEAEQLHHAFVRGNAHQVRSLQRGSMPGDTSWCAGDGWWLSTRANI